MRFLLPLIFLYLFYPVFAQEPSLKTRYFTETDQVFPNPERGFYRYTELTGLSSLPDLRKDHVTLIFGKIQARVYRDRDFTESFLTRIQASFDLARAAGVKVNVRVSYSDDIGQPDASRDQVFRHIDQLQSLFVQNMDVINLVEAGFIGAWGEWHSSTNGLDTPENRRAILFKLLSALPKERMVVIRTPHFKREIFSDSILTLDRAFDGTFLARTGFHNDCFLSSANDYGTYLRPRSEEIAYIGAETRFTPFGGETCSVYKYSGCDHALYEMAQLHCSYLNDGWYPEVLNLWTNQGCMAEIKRRLGYRFVLRTVDISEMVRPGGVLTVNFAIENVGFAAPHNPRRVELVLRNNQTQDIAITGISVEPRYWLPGDTIRVKRKFRIPYHWPQGQYRVGLRFPDPVATLYDDPRYAIRLANDDTWDEETGTNIILNDLPIDTTATGTIDENATEFKEITGTSSLRHDANTQPRYYGLFAFPNPFNNGVQIQFILAKNDHVWIKIYNSHGALVTVLVDTVKFAGHHKVNWDGTDGQGRMVASGIYFVELATKSVTEKVGVTLLR